MKGKAGIINNKYGRKEGRRKIENRKVEVKKNRMEKSEETK